LHSWIEPGDRTTEAAEALPGIVEDCRMRGTGFRSRDRIGRA